MSYTIEEIREGLSKILLPKTEEETQKLYDENPKYQHVSYEVFKRRMKEIKTIIEDAKLRYAVKG